MSLSVTIASITALIMLAIILGTGIMVIASRVIGSEIKAVLLTPLSIAATGIGVMGISGFSSISNTSFDFIVVILVVGTAYLIYFAIGIFFGKSKWLNPSTTETLILSREFHPAEATSKRSHFVSNFFCGLSR